MDSRLLATIDTYRWAGKDSGYDLDSMSADAKLGKEDRLFKSWPLPANISPNDRTPSRLIPDYSHWVA